MNNFVEPISNINLSTITSHSEDNNNDLFMAGCNSLLINSDSRAARDFYLLLMVYVNYFYVPVFSFALKSLYALRNSVQFKFGEIERVANIAISFFMESKEFIAILPSSRMKQVECNFVSRNIYRKTVLL
tara:strand:- start:900 stop:1289 length:390 start_codon:yes stop_codon:yes gene_type:complete